MISEYEAPSIEPLSPGTALKKARKGLGLTVEEVAGELRLSASQIRALECDDYADLPGLTYVRGYLRSYARLVKIDEQSVLPPLQPEPAAKPMPAVARSVQRQARSSDRWVRLMSYGLGISLVVLVIAWWRSQGGLDFDQDLFADRTTSETRGDVKQPAANAARSRTAEDTPARPVAPSMSESTAESKATGGRNIPSRGDQPEPARDREQLATANRDDPSPGGGNDAVAAAAAQRIGKVQLRFSDASWVEIRDAKNARLVHESFNPGHALEVEGAPPFRIFLGNAAGVSMQLNGKPFDITPHQTGLYARFVVDVQENN